MSEYAWFKLLVRAIGILLLGFSIPTLVSVVFWVLSEIAAGVAPAQAAWLRYLASIVFDLTRAGIGAYLLLGGEGLIRFCVRDLSRRCLGCGYPLENLTGNACPECGLPLARSAPAPPQQNSDPPASVT